MIKYYEKSQWHQQLKFGGSTLYSPLKKLMLATLMQLIMFSHVLV
jgi:hypothetical protein